MVMLISARSPGAVMGAPAGPVSASDVIRSTAFGLASGLGQQAGQATMSSIRTAGRHGLQPDDAGDALSLFAALFVGP